MIGNIFTIIAAILLLGICVWAALILGVAVGLESARIWEARRTPNSVFRSQHRQPHPHQLGRLVLFAQAVREAVRAEREDLRKLKGGQR
jgi:hypothetical protein